MPVNSTANEHPAPEPLSLLTPQDARKEAHLLRCYLELPGDSEPRARLKAFLTHARQTHTVAIKTGDPELSQACMCRICTEEPGRLRLIVIIPAGTPSHKARESMLQLLARALYCEEPGVHEWAAKGMTQEKALALSARVKAAVRFGDAFAEEFLYGARPAHEEGG